MKPTIRLIRSIPRHAVQTDLHRRRALVGLSACAATLALPAAFAVAPDQCNTALEKLDQAQQLAPNYGLPRALAAWCLSQRAAQHFGSTPREDLERASGLSARALGEPIFAEADSVEDLRKQVRDAVRCHFEDEHMPRGIRLRSR